jgi:histidyl-tRNA synthetase
MRYQAPRGTEDVLPTASHHWLHVEYAFREIAQRYGYRELRTPTFEDTDVFLRTSGETSDIVTKQMYNFIDKGDRPITLKPELTAPAMRSVIEHNLCPPGTVLRMSYVGPIFRYERPQKGRLREAHQLGLELVGSSSPAADAEVIELTVRFYESVGLSNLVVSLNTVGRSECMSRYRAAILAHVGPWLEQQPEEARAKAVKNPLRLLDTKDPATKEALVGLPSIHDFLEDASRENFETLKALLTEANVNFVVDPAIVRGLDYYTETVFEVQSNHLGAQSSLCGGGRYDNLSADLGGKSTPSVGVGMGIERLLIALEAEGKLPPAPAPDAFIIAATADANPVVRQIARDLRNQGFEIWTDLESRSLKSQLRQADGSGARTAIIVGSEELAQGTAQVKNLLDAKSESSQQTVPLAELASFLRKS